MASDTVDKAMTTLDDLLKPTVKTPTSVKTAEIIHSTQDAAVIELMSDGTKALLPAVNWYDDVAIPQKHTRIQVTADDDIADQDMPTCTVRHPSMPSLLLAAVSPPIREGLVKVVKYARMPGVRSKIVLAPTDADYDKSRTNPVREILSPGASSVMYVSRVLYGERIDLIPWSPDKRQLLAAAVAAYNPSGITIKGADATISVKPSDLSSAVGYRGSNSRLVGELTGLRITFVES